MANPRLRSLIKAAAENIQAANRPNPYVVGFMSKCAEAGLPEEAAIALLQKKAFSPTLGGAIGGGALGALLSKPEIVKDKDGNEKKKYHRFRNALLGGTLGGVLGAAGGAAYRNWTPAGRRMVEQENAQKLEFIAALKALANGGAGEAPAAE